MGGEHAVLHAVLLDRSRHWTLLLPLYSVSINTNHYVRYLVLILRGLNEIIYLNDSEKNSNSNSRIPLVPTPCSLVTDLHELVSVFLTCNA